MNDHPMAHAAQLSPSEVSFRYDGLTSLFDLGLDFWWYDENWGGIIPGLDFGGGEVRVMALSTKLMVFAHCVNDCSHINTHTHTHTHTHTYFISNLSLHQPTTPGRSSRVGPRDFPFRHKRVQSTARCTYQRLQHVDTVHVLLVASGNTPIPW
jgi:hypothetical protein